MAKRLYVQVKSAKTGAIISQVRVSKSKLDKLLTIPKIRAWAKSLSKTHTVGWSFHSTCRRGIGKFKQCNGGCPIWEYLNVFGVVGHEVDGDTIDIASTVYLDRHGYFNDHSNEENSLLHYKCPSWVSKVVRLVDNDCSKRVTSNSLLKILDKVSPER